MTINYKWTLFIQYGGGQKQWTLLQHNGPLFPEEYKPHKTPIIVKGNEIILPVLAEEYATMYARFLDTEYIQNNTFKKNFWKDFKPTLKELNIELTLDDIDFSLIKKYYDKQKEIKLHISDDEKKRNKIKQTEIEEPYQNCIIDGAQQKIGNYKVEPPGIFLGRGNHPKLGMIKKRVYPIDVTLNLSKNAPIPNPNINNLDGSKKWGDIINDTNVIWLASWKDNISGKVKYIFTSLESFFKSKSDEDKFDLARNLKKKVNTIRNDYEKQLVEGDIKSKQLATALYFIDHLALRVGSNKDTKEEADTVGVTSLRVEHLTLLEDNTIKLDFLGKDSVRFCKKIKVIDAVYTNLQDFSKDKKNKAELFEHINASILNEYLNSFMPGLTAKVWRTYNASLLFQKDIDKIKEEHIKDIEPNEKLNYLIAMFNQANTSVALLCNHQKNVNHGIDNMITKIDNRIKELKKNKLKQKNKDRIKRIDIKIKSLKLKKDTKLKMKNVSLGTSKNNYIDPRIIFSFIKRFDIPPQKLFTDKLIKRFEWANKVDKDYHF
jgi:DNA topoisomerase-1